MTDSPVDPGRSRAGNAMARTRAAVLTGARQCIIKHGSRKTTMVDIAATAGVAKATLYNHFRTKTEVYTALVDTEVRQAVEDTISSAEAVGTLTAIARLAERLGEHPVARRLAAHEPGVLAGLLLPEQAGTGAAVWQVARDGLAHLLGDDPSQVELMLRFLVTQLLWPSTREESVAAVTTLLTSSPELPALAEADVPGADGELSVPGASDAFEGAPVTLVLPIGGGELPRPADGDVVPGLGWPSARQPAERVGVV